MQLYDIIDKLDRHNPCMVVVPCANDPDIICAIARAMALSVARFTLIGNQSAIEFLARSQGVNISAASFVSTDDELEACDRAAAMAHAGEAQVIIKGLVQSSNFIKAILNKKYGLIEFGKLISCVAMVNLPSYHKPLLLTDPGVNIAPNLEQKVEILRNAIYIARRLGIDVPKAACVETVEKVNPKLPGTEDALSLKNMAAEGAFGDAIVDGPFGFDVAFSRSAAKIKSIDSSVAGDPDILLMPQMVSANVLYKSMVWFGGATVASIVTGARLPIVLTSRSDTEETKLLSIALAVYLTNSRQ